MPEILMGEVFSTGPRAEDRAEHPELEGFSSKLKLAHTAACLVDFVPHGQWTIEELSQRAPRGLVKVEEMNR